MLRIILVVGVCLIYVTSNVEAGRGLSIPQGMEQEDYCKGCIETVTVIAKKQKNSKPEDVIKGMGKLCKSIKGENNRTSCFQLVEHHLEDLKTVLNHKEKSKKLIAHFCYEHSFACTGLKNYSSKLKHEKSDEELKEALESMDHIKRVPNPVRRTDEL